MTTTDLGDGSAPAPLVSEVVAGRTLINPSDPDEVVRRCLLLGFSVVRRWSGAGDHGVVLTFGGSLLEVSSRRREPPRGVRLWVQVVDIRSAREGLMTGGYPGPVGPAVKQPWGLLECEVGLCDGVDVVLVEAPPGHGLHPGAIG